MTGFPGHVLPLLICFIPAGLQPECVLSQSEGHARLELRVSEHGHWPCAGAGASMSTRPPQTEEGTGDERLLYSLGLLLRIG